MPSVSKKAPAKAQAKERTQSSSSNSLSKILKRKHDEPKTQNSSKKSKPSLKPPTSISRPRKPESTSAKKPIKAKTPEPRPQSDEEEDAEPTSDQEDSEEHDHLHGFSTDDDDSSDEDAMDDEPSEFDLGKLPTIAKDDATVKRKLEKAKQQQTEDRGVLFLGRLPHGFYEDQLKAYFSQFGDVTRLRVSRNKKTGKSKHYGFIEFDSAAVAQIVAETMDNYLLMGHILRCKVIPKDQVHPELWVGANRKWRIVPKDRVARTEHNKPRTETQQARAAKRLLKRQQERQRKLKEAGISYSFDAVSYKKPASVKV
ncbi:hypothetical protein CPB84DRAFT_1772215 [Gymnopilus junonius]|uniref:RRM domain-containing protein n=1 Tax=Gymnopilus junonius TaxID=109634 RepID=A0A9P5NV35_GYMJU|nr:hypothetical protein CPB84DRAFT_1772215 [Gymnopilus junonius]